VYNRERDRFSAYSACSAVSCVLPLRSEQKLCPNCAILGNIEILAKRDIAVGINERASLTRRLRLRACAPSPFADCKKGRQAKQW
jgi:hypothetical protein